MLRRILASFLCVAFIATSHQPVLAQGFSVTELPAPGTMVGASASFVPLSLKGIVVNPKKPLEFQFIVDTGKGPRDAASVKEESDRLVKYFLAGLTIPEGDLWVNLSPYEKDRMLPEALGQTELGRDLLAQDYILKQLTATLIYPEKELGKEFWTKVYAQAQQQFGTTNIPVNTFNKVWILPNQAQVFENKNAAYVTKATLKVMLDEDYLAKTKNTKTEASNISSQIIRSLILPAIEKEVNEGQNFAPLRQIYQAMILAKWYKETIKNGLLEAVYMNKNKTQGVNLQDFTVKDQIYQRYVQAYKKGVFNYIKEDEQAVPRKYFSGGITGFKELPVRRDGSRAMVVANGEMMSVVVSLLEFSKSLLSQPLVALAESQYTSRVMAFLEKYSASDALTVGVVLGAVLGAGAAYAAWKVLRTEDTGKDSFQQEKVEVEAVLSLKPGEVAIIEDGKVKIVPPNENRLSEERALYEIGQAIDSGKLTTDFKSSWDGLKDSILPLGLAFAPTPVNIVQFIAGGDNDERVMRADTKEIVPLAQFYGFDQIKERAYRFAWNGTDGLRHGLYVVFPKDPAMFSLIPQAMLFASTQFNLPSQEWLSRNSMTLAFSLIGVGLAVGVGALVVLSVKNRKSSPRLERGDYAMLNQIRNWTSTIASLDISQLTLQAILSKSELEEVIKRWVAENPWSSGFYATGLSSAIFYYLWSNYTIHGIVTTYPSNREVEFKLKRYFKGKSSKFVSRFTEHEWDVVCQSAIEALAAIGDEEAVEAIIRVLNSKREKFNYSFVRRDAAALLGQLGNVKAVKPLLAALKDEHLNVAKSASAALREFKVDEEDIFNAYVDALSSSDHFTRSFAASTLAEIGNKRAIDPLLTALEQSNRWDLKEIVDALVGFGVRDEHVAKLAMKLLMIRVGDDVLNKLEFLGADQRDIFIGLIDALKSGDEKTRVEVAIKLGDIGNKDAVKDLLELLNDGSRDVNVAAAESIVKLEGLQVDKQELVVVLKRLIEFVKQNGVHTSNPFRFLERAVDYERQGGFRIIYTPYSGYEEYDEDGRPTGVTVIVQEEVMRIEPIGKSEASPAMIRKPIMATTEGLYGGIDLNEINLNREGKAVVVDFDAAQLRELILGGFEGFKPLIVSVTSIISPLPLLGVQ